jgi:uncharacterized protein (DUF849 family)
VRPNSTSSPRYMNAVYSETRAACCMLCVTIAIVYWCESSSISSSIFAVERLRRRNPALILNITTGPGGRFIPSEHDPKIAAPGTSLMVPEKRVEHISVLRPEICTLDLNTMTFGKQVVINTPPNVRRMVKVIREAGVKPEIELFDSGDIALMQDLIRDGTLAGPHLVSFVLGVKYGFQTSPETVIYARGLLPPDAQFTAFGVGRWSFPGVALSYLSGGHVRVGLEDGVQISKGVLAESNAQMVEKARHIVEELGGQIATSAEAREMLGISSRSSATRRAS